MADHSWALRFLCLAGGDKVCTKCGVLSVWRAASLNCEDIVAINSTHDWKETDKDYWICLKCGFVSYWIREPAISCNKTKQLPITCEERIMRKALE